MSHPGLDPGPDPDLAAALEALAELGPLQVLDVHPTPPERRPPPPPAPAAGPDPAQPGLFDPEPAPAPPATTDPYRHHPSSRHWRPVARHDPLSPTPSTWRSRS
jgi:hypothetical protein